MSNTDETLARLEERIISMQDDLKEIKGNGVETKKRIRTLENVSGKHTVYFKAVPYTLGILSTILGIAWFFLRVL